MTTKNCFIFSKLYIQLSSFIELLNLKKQLYEQKHFFTKSKYSPL